MYEYMMEIQREEEKLQNIWTEKCISKKFLSKY